MNVEKRERATLKKSFRHLFMHLNCKTQNTLVRRFPKQIIESAIKKTGKVVANVLSLAVSYQEIVRSLS